MPRETISLEGMWDFFVGDMQYKGKIYVPSVIQAEFPELKDYYGTFYYKRVFSIPKDWLNKKILLKFMAVDYYTEVWINNNYIGNHEGGFLPFCFSIEDYVKEGKNEILVKVIDSNKDKIRFPEFSQDEIPHGKAHDAWYGNISGIWQKVYLEKVEIPYVEKIKIFPDIDNKKAKIEVYINDLLEHCVLITKITDPEGRIFQKEISISSNRLDIEFYFPEVILWSINNPKLYNVEMQIYCQNILRDIYKTNFGMRKIEVRDGEIYLNDEKIYLFGALDQDYYPEKIYIPNSIEDIRKRFKKAKEMGLNLLRTHVKVPLPEYLSLADEMGILIWEELPYWENLTEKAKDRAEKTLIEMIERDFNHPSVVIWGIVNESWGIDLSERENREWLKRMYEFVKKNDPTRLVVDNSPCIPNFHIKTDIEDFHFYTSIPDHFKKWEDYISGFSKRDFWSYSPYGDAEKGEKPLVISEFGNWGLYNIPENFVFHIPTRIENSSPWLVRKEYYKWHLDSVFGTFEEFVKATQWHEFLSLKHEIEVLRKHPTIKGYVITELTDVFWESNGLLDPWGNPKVFHDSLKWINNLNFVSLTSYKANWFGGEETCFSVEGYLDSPAKLVVMFGDSDVLFEKNLEDLEFNKWQKLGEFILRFPEVDSITKKRLNLYLKDRNERILAKNYYNFYIYPKEEAKKEPKNLKIVTCLTEEIKEFLKEGNNVLLLSKDEYSLGFLKDEKKWQIVSKKKDFYHGDWINNFNFHRKKSIFLELPLSSPWDFAFYNLIPEKLIVNVNSEYAENILAGTIYGWVFALGGYLLEVPFENGKIILSTLSFRDFTDPLVLWIWNRLIEKYD